jgi:hypothetical protein
VRCPPRLPWRSPPPRRLRGSAARTWPRRSRKSIHLCPLFRTHQVRRHKSCGGSSTESIGRPPHRGVTATSQTQRCAGGTCGPPWMNREASPKVLWSRCKDIYQ